METFNQSDLMKLWQPKEDSAGEDNGQVTIIGGSKLFHGAPILSLKAASRLVDMVFFASPEESIGRVAEQIKAQLNSFIWVPWEETIEYVNKSDAALVGPGFMRFRSEKVLHMERHNSCDEECRYTREITQKFLSKFPDKKWIIDGGSLQVMEAGWIPKNAVVTPNKKEFEMLFGEEMSIPNMEAAAKKYKCIIVGKGPVAYVSDGETTYEVGGGNAGLTKGGTGDTLAGVIVGLLAKNEPLMAAAAGSFLVKKTADELYEKVGYGYNADDLADGIFSTKMGLKKRG